MDFNNASLFSRIDFVMGPGRGVTLIKGGNTNGSAVLGVFTNLRRPASNNIRQPGSFGVKCLPRRLLIGSGGAIIRRIGVTFTSRLSRRTGISTVARRLTSEASCRDRDCRRLVRQLDIRGRHLLVVGDGGVVTTVRGALVNLNFLHSSFRHGASRFSNN